jgi:hypothetical protein
MRTATRGIAIACGVLTAAACGSSDSRQWLKLNQPYTVAEFRRDYAECTTRGKLNEACMRDRGWVDVSPSKVEKPTLEPEHRARPSYGTPPPSRR